MALESVVAATVEFAVGKLLEIATEEVKLVWGFKGDLTNFKNALQMINQVLKDADKRQINDDAVKLWLNKLEDATYYADDVLDRIKYENLLRQVEIRNQIKPSGCLNMISFCSPLVFRWKMAHRIKDVNAVLKMINDEADRRGFEKRVADSPLYLPPVNETDSKADDPVFVGREKEIESFVQKITTAVDDVLSVLPIVGMGGIGKTTLARRIFNDQRLEQHFKKIWVCVSKNFDLLKLFNRILEELKGTSRGDSRESIVNAIQEELKNERFLLVVDDMWNENEDYWNDFTNTLRGVSSKKGNVILVTTRNDKVASTVGLRNNEPPRLEKLSNDDCWSIIKAMAFEGGNVPQGLEHILNVGMEIASQCRGSPLAAKMMGKVLRRTEIHEWNSIKEKGPSNPESDENSVRQVLKISFDRLPSSALKQCFAYCSILPKDTEISRESLIQLWMAEGFLADTPKDDMESMGNTIFHVLLKNSFMEEPEKDEYGIIKTCKIHNLVHDLARDIAKSKFCTLAEDHTKYDLSRVRSLAIPSGRQEAMENPKYKISSIRTLILEPGAPSKNVSDFKHLRTLILWEADEGCLTSIGELIHLKCLDLSRTHMKRLPDTVCKLYNLQTLNIMECYIEQLPEKLQDLISLRHLCFDADNDFLMPPNIGRLSCLRTLRFFNVSDKECCGIEELGTLKNLQGELEVRNLELVKDRAEAEKANLGGKPNIRKLKFCWTEAARDDITINDESVFDGLQPHPNLKILKVEGFRGKNFPLWTLKMLKLDNLIEVEFVDCIACEEVPMLGHLPLLKHLKFSRLNSIRSIGLSFYGTCGFSSTSSGHGKQMILSFPSLKSLIMEDLPNLTEWAEIETDKAHVFHCLEYLHIRRCPRVTHLPHLRGSGSSLQRLCIKNCDSLKEWHVDMHRIESLETLELSSCENLDLIPHKSSGQTYSLSFLHQLIITNCNNLRGLPNGMFNSCTSLRHINVSHCKNLTSFPKLSEMGRDNSLRILEIGGFSDSMDFTTFLDIFDGLERMESLQRLTLHGRIEWVTLPEQLQNLTSVRKVAIHNFGLEVFPEWIAYWSSLQSLLLYGFDNLKSKWFPTVASQRFTSLGKQLVHLKGRDRGFHQVFVR